MSRGFHREQSGRKKQSLLSIRVLVAGHDIATVGLGLYDSFGCWKLG